MGVPRRFFSSNPKQDVNHSVVQTEVSLKALVRCSTSEARKLVPFEIAQRLSVLPIGLFKGGGNDLLHLASLEDKDREVISTLRFVTGKNISLIKVEEELLKKAILNAYNGDDDLLVRSVSTVKKFDSSLSKNKDKLILVETDRISEAEIPQFLNRIILYAVAQGASDIHLLPRFDGLVVRLRVSGELYEHKEPICSLETYKHIVRRVKVLANLDITVSHIPLDGNFSIKSNGEEIEVRIGTIPTVHGEKITLRLINSLNIYKLEELLLTKKILGFLEYYISNLKGVMLVAGPTGSGKSTTLYSVLQYLSHRNLNIVTIEDPVEMQLKGATQISIDEKVGRDYPRCIKALLRHDPDLILVGEIRDSETAETAFRVSLTGHALLSTVHAGDVIETLMRLENLGVERTILGGTLQLIIVQRLLPKLCTKCRVINIALSNKFNREIYRAVGCSLCDQSGYIGRVLCAEALLLDRSVRQSIASDGSGITRLLNCDNYCSFRESIEELCFGGIIDGALLLEE